MISKADIDKLAKYINKEIVKKLGNKLDTLYLVGSYTSGNISLSRPDINWLLIHKDPIEDESRWKLGEILTESTDKFINSFVVRPELRPFKFSYPIKRGEEVFVNLSIVTNAKSDKEFKIKNSFLPEYVFEGFKQSRKLVFGKDILEKIDFIVDKKRIWSSAFVKILDHKIQLDRVPLVYHLERDLDLVYNEAVAHGKNLLFFAIELVMSDKELKNKKFLEVTKEKNGIYKFLLERWPELAPLSEKIDAAKKNFNKWKTKKEKVHEIYLTASQIADIMLLKVIRSKYE